MVRNLARQNAWEEEMGKSLSELGMLMEESTLACLKYKLLSRYGWIMFNTLNIMPSSVVAAEEEILRDVLFDLLHNEDIAKTFSTWMYYQEQMRKKAMRRTPSRY